MADDGFANSEDLISHKHRQERKELQAEIQKLKRSIPKGDANKKREITEEIALLQANLDEKQNQELTDSKESTVTEVSRLTDDLDGLSCKDGESETNQTNATQMSQPRNAKPSKAATQMSQPRNAKPSKAQRRRDKKSAKSHEREDRIQTQEVENLLGDRHVEMTKIKDILDKRQLGIFEIPSDGNCLYNAVSDQLNRRHIQSSNKSLRLQVGNYMKDCSDEFLPFMCKPETGDSYTAEEYETYCTDLITTAAWGGQLEIKALSQALHQFIEIIQATGPSVMIGQEYETEPLLLSYHRYAYGLGEHYNSVVNKSEIPSEDEFT